MAKGKYRLVCDREVIQKAFVWYNGTLGDSIDAIGPVGAQLEDAMPMLRRDIKVPNTSQKREGSYNRGHLVQGSVLKLIVDINLKLVALRSVEIGRQREKYQWIPPCLPGLLDQGKRPRRVLYWGVLV
jgi:hypothetical protein